MLFVLLQLQRLMILRELNSMAPLHYTSRGTSEAVLRLSDSQELWRGPGWCPRTGAMSQRLDRTKVSFSAKRR
jgi:hypothetical protein